jgi:hypothetical protein
VEAYIEVPFSLGEERVYPDGLLRVRRGARVWTALVEVKTGGNVLAARQLENYLDVAREQGFDALVTISNEIPATPGAHPTSVDKRKLKKVALHHYSWSQVLAAAVVQKEHRGVADPDQSWILGELIRYLEHPRSGALEFEDMGASWVPVRQGITAGTLRPGDKGRRRGRRPVRRVAALRQPAVGPPARDRGHPGADPQRARRPGAALAVPGGRP